MFKKIKSNKGYIFTYEAVIVAFIFLSIFYVSYMVYSHNMLTAIEEKRDTEKFHKALLLKDVYLKKYEFPGKFYNEDYIQNFTKYLKLKEKTFDLLNNFSEYNGSFYFVIYPNTYDEMLSNIISNENDLNPIPVPFNDRGKIINFTIYSNVNVTPNYILPSISGSDIIYFKENLYIPKITYKRANIYNPKIYGCEGDVIFFSISNVTNTSNITISIDTYDNYSIFTINGRIYELNETNSTEILPSIDFHTINEIRILHAEYPIIFKFIYSSPLNISYVVFSPRNITIMVKP